MFASSFDPPPSSIRPSSLAPSHSSYRAHATPRILLPSLLSPALLDEPAGILASHHAAPDYPNSHKTSHQHTVPALTPAPSPPLSAISTLALPRPISPLPVPDFPIPHDAAGSHPSLVTSRKGSMAAPNKLIPVIQAAHPETPPLADTLPRSMQGLRSLGGSTARPRHFKVSKSVDCLDVDGKSSATRTARAGSAQRHLLEYQAILDNLTSPNSVSSDTVRPNGGGVIRIGDAEIPRVGIARPDLEQHPGEAESARGSEGRSISQGMSRVKKNWCWYCQNDLPCALMERLEVEVKGEYQWVCKGCDARPARLD